MDSSIPVNPSEPKMPMASMNMQHKDFPAARDMMPGEEGVMKVHYKVRSHSRHDDGHGNTDVDIHKIEHEGKPNKKKNAANMPMDELKNVIKASEKPNDQPNS